VIVPVVSEGLRMSASENMHQLMLMKEAGDEPRMISVNWQQQATRLQNPS
jgi:hypothetical protein